MSIKEKIESVEPCCLDLSITEQCRLLGLSRSMYYYEPAKESELNLNLMNRIDELTTEYPFYGSRQLVNAFSHEGIIVNRKRIQRLMKIMGLETLYCRPKT